MENVIPMSNSISSLREEDVREQEGQNPPDAESSFGDILNQFEQSHTHEAPGEKGVEATVVAVREDKVFFDVGQKIEGVMDASLLRDDKGLIELKPGDTVQVGINGRNEEGYIQLSLIRVERPKDWSGLQKAFDEKLTISGTVTSVIKGGLAVDIGMRAFMPASRSGARDVPEMQTLVGRRSHAASSSSIPIKKTSWSTGAWCLKKSAQRPRNRGSTNCM